EGRLAYIVRISNARAASLLLADRAGAPDSTVEVVAQAPGAAGNSIQVQVTETQALNTLTAFKHNPAITGVSGTEITFGSTDDAAKFRPGDLVSIESDPKPAPPASVLRINGDTVTLSQPL